MQYVVSSSIGVAVHHPAHTTITADALREAIAETNRTRALLLRLAALRCAYPPRVSGSEALAIIGASGFMPKVEYNALLQRFLDDEIQDTPLPTSTACKAVIWSSPCTLK